jgi:hypothetical protein
MAGFEVVVRPVVLPNIRPPQAQVLPAEDNPEQGLMVIKGSGTTSIGASYAWSISWTKSKPHQETKRQYDTERVYQKDNTGEINKNAFVDVERLKKVRAKTGDGPIRQLYADPPKRDNVEIMNSNMTRESSDP